MKCFILASLAGAVLLSGCASTENPDGKVAKSEESYIPLGTLIARKSPNRAESTKVVDKQALENDRLMGGAGRSDGR